MPDPSVRSHHVERPRALLVEDDRDFASEMQDLLDRYGFDVTALYSTHDLETTIASFRPDILVLDQFVQNQDLLSQLSEIRRNFRGGIMVLTGNPDATDRIMSLEGGADDFVQKMTEPREIVARMRALVRRTQATGPASQAPASVPAAAVAPSQGWNVIPGRREVVSADGSVIPLTGLEFELFHELYQRRGQVVSRDELAARVLRRSAEAAGRSVENLISRIRMKLERHQGGEPLIKTVRGRGYVFLEGS